ncbi:alkane hydroxylase MAH1-like [Papaver somniferum]|uniref:alkane hydroxylase MAH1-like n=1 Tax=Papaver somniferum TaxID=3469 RepID=UPI000E6FB491|nr:alkane hydroxylase MAH1-like [Papaver somniferum]
MDIEYFPSSCPFFSKAFSVICCIFLCFLPLGLYFRNASKAVNYWIFVGTIPSLILNSKRLSEWFVEVFSSLGKSSFYIDGPMFSNLRYLVTCHPQNIEYILKTNFNNFPKGEDFRDVFDILGDGIFNVDSDRWKIQRKFAHAEFSSREFRTLVSSTNRKVVEEQLVPFLAHVSEEGSSIDLQDVCSRFSFEVNINVIFGRYENYLSIELPSNELAVAVDDAQEAILYRHIRPMFFWKLLRMLETGKERKLKKARKKVHQILEDYINQKKKDLLGGVRTFDCLSTYIKALQDNTSIVSSLPNKDIFLRDEMLTFLIAGRDTITSGLTWFFWLVSKTSAVETKILEELKFVLSTKNSEKETGSARKWPWIFGSEDLKGLVYLHAALCESLRLYPPLPINRKSAVKKDQLPDGSTVTPGIEILLSFYSVGRMPWIWGEDCLEFKPERWIAENGKLITEPLYKFFPFNIGPRTCIGKDISFTLMKSVVSAVLFNFHVEVVKGHHVCSKPFINLHMKNGLKVNIKKRVTI